MCPCLVDIEIVDTRNGGQGLGLLLLLLPWVGRRCCINCHCGWAGTAAAAGGRELLRFWMARRCFCCGWAGAAAASDVLMSVIPHAPCPGNESNLVTAGQEACMCDDPTRKVCACTQLLSLHNGRMPPSRAQASLRWLGLCGALLQQRAQHSVDADVDAECCAVATA